MPYVRVGGSIFMMLDDSNYNTFAIRQKVDSKRLYKDLAEHFVHCVRL